MPLDELLNKKISLGDELGNSCKQLIAGLKELQTSVQDTDYYFIAFQLIDNGFERLLKCAICYGWLKKNNSFPKTKDIKNGSTGHDINLLLTMYLERYFSQKTQGLVDDYKYLSSNNDVKSILESLSEFGNYARYHNLNVVTGEKNITDIKEIWNKMEMDHITQNDDLYKKMFVEPDYKAVQQSVTKYLVCIIERITRSIVRQFTLGELGDEPKKYIGDYSHFLSLTDSTIGKTNYFEKFYLKKIDIPTDYSKNINNKTFVIKESECIELWPFKNTKEIILEKINEYYIFIIINNKKYALNGFTASKYKLPFPHDCGESFVGRSIGYFINVAQNM